MADQPQPLAIAGISRAVIAPDGDRITLALVDMENAEYEISLSFEALGQTIVKLLAAALTARGKRAAGDDMVEMSLMEDDVIAPFPIVSYALGLSDDKTQIVLRLVSDNDLIWNFVLPEDAVERLRADLARLRQLAGGGDGGQEPA